jgi:hypothetical protein
MFAPVLDHRICASCRYTTKYVPGPCPHCGQSLVNMGKNFKAPRKDNVVQWRKLELVIVLRRAGRHHPNCWYAQQAAAGVHYDDTRWGVAYCRCPWLKNFQTPADVKSGLGRRRSRRKNYAAPVARAGRPRPRYDYGRAGV